MEGGREGEGKNQNSEVQMFLLLYLYLHICFSIGWDFVGVELLV